MYGYGKAIAHLVTHPANKSTEVYRYAIDYLTGHQRAADALTKYVRKSLIDCSSRITIECSERNAHDTQALHCLGIVDEFNQRFAQAARSYQL